MVTSSTRQPQRGPTRSTRSNLYIKLHLQRDLYITTPSFTLFDSFERGWAGQTWTWSSQCGCFPFSPDPVLCGKIVHTTQWFTWIIKNFALTLLLDFLLAGSEIKTEEEHQSIWNFTPLWCTMSAHYLDDLEICVTNTINLRFITLIFFRNWHFEYALFSHIYSLDGHREFFKSS